jgi:hypothetical protein
MYFDIMRELSQLERSIAVYVLIESIVTPRLLPATDMAVADLVAAFVPLRWSWLYRYV